MIRYVTQNDENQILSMMELVNDDFAGYKENEFLEAMYHAISNDEAVMAEKDDIDREEVRGEAYLLAGSMDSIVRFGRDT